MGGRHRVACSGGIIGCPDVHATSDGAAPDFANRILNNDEIAGITPTTDLTSHWRQVSCCSSVHGDYYSTLYKDLSLVNSVQGCANMVLHPGTYLFIVRTLSGTCSRYSDPFTGDTGGYIAQMAIFDHDVSYKSIHAISVFWHFIDVDSPEFTDWDFHAPTGNYCDVSIPDNITGLETVPRQLCVYELQ